MSRSENSGRLLIERQPRDGRWNMAFDEALLEAAADRAQTSLRVYRWAAPTLSLGYFQKSVPDDLPANVAGLPRLKRLSGGGAILHHLEWTYSCAVPRGHALARRPEVLYEAAHRALIEAFALQNVGTATLRGDFDPPGESAFLCFRRGDPRDVVLAGRKVVGSAQRRRRGAVLQHGSVLLRRSPLAPELPGLLDLAGVSSDDPLWAAATFASIFGRSLFASEPLSEPHEADLAAAREKTTAYDGAAGAASHYAFVSSDLRIDTSASAL